MTQCSLFKCQGGFSSRYSGENGGKWNGALAVCVDRSYQCCTADGEMEQKSLVMVSGSRGGGGDTVLLDIKWKCGSDTAECQLWLLCDPLHCWKKRGHTACARQSSAHYR